MGVVKPLPSETKSIKSHALNSQYKTVDDRSESNNSSKAIVAAGTGSESSTRIKKEERKGKTGTISTYRTKITPITNLNQSSKPK